MEPWDIDAPGLDPRFLHHRSKNIAGLGLDELKILLVGLGEPTYRALQVFEGIYKHKWLSWGQFSNLPKTLREKLESESPILWPQIVCSAVSIDGSTKHALVLADDNRIECVYIPYENRATMCISTQVGCAMGCTFCATGGMGIKRNLTPAEIVAQVMALAFHHRHKPENPINIVFMGMGEPLHNLEALMGAFATLSHPAGLAVPPRRMTLSTVGYLPGIQRLGGHSPRPRLALSLNATTDESRSKIMPANRVWGLGKLLDALISFPLGADERITLEYVLIRGFNDSQADARRLSAFAAHFPSKINLIPYNPYAGSELLPPEESKLNDMAKHIADRGMTVSVRRSRGQDIGGACGQLVVK